jgi:catalase
MLGHLNLIDPDLGTRVADGLGMVGQADDLTPAREPIELDPSPPLSILAKQRPTLVGRKVGCMIGDGFDRGLVERLRAAVTEAGAMFEICAPKIGGALAADGTQVPADHMISGGPSVIFDAVVVAPGAAAIPNLLLEAAARQWVADAFAHCKVIGVVGAAQPLLAAAGVKPDAGVIEITAKSIDAYVKKAKAGRIWAREVTTLGPDRKVGKSPPPAKRKPAAPPAKSAGKSAGKAARR